MSESLAPRGSRQTIEDLPAVADLYCELYEEPKGTALRDYWPGLLVTAAAVLAAGFLSQHYGAPLALMGLLIGLSLSFLSEDTRLRKGLGFASHSLLRLGIMLVGLRITLSQIADLGPAALVAIVAILAITLFSGILCARALGYDIRFGTLAGGSVAICGASAAAALSTVLNTRRANPAYLPIVLVSISAVSAVGMSLYPMLAHAFGLSDRQAGFFLGASIHDVAQALGAGYSYSEAAGETATIVKLTRVALLAPVLGIVAYFLAPKDSQTRKFTRIPWFILGFLALVVVNSLQIVPAPASAFLNGVAPVLVASAITAAGISAPLNALMAAGLRPLMVIVAASLVALVASLIGAIVVL